MIYDRQEECMRVTLQMHFTHAHLEPLKAAHSTYISMYCYGRALGNNPGPVTGSGSLSVEWHSLTGTEALKSCLAMVGHSTWHHTSPHVKMVASCSAAREIQGV